MDSGDSLKLSKLRCKDLLDLALCAPKGYEDTRLSTGLADGMEVVVAVEIISFTQKRGHAQALARLPRFGHTLELLIFHPSKYHRTLFAPDAQLTLKGKIKKSFTGMSLIQPKPVSHVGAIFPKFGMKIFKDATLHELTSRLLTQESLLAVGIPNQYAQAIEEIFSPTVSFYESYRRRGGFSGVHLEALKFLEIYRYVGRLQTKRHLFKTLYSVDASPKPFLESLPFSPTKGQREALAAIARDFASPHAARRVIMGDVGCGKTIVILAAAFMIYPKKSVLMAPTTILARQLFLEAKRYLPTSWRIALLTQEQARGGLEADLLIGTHALLYQSLDEAALVMIDEQHRFGTLQRKALEKQLSGNREERAHVLQFSATPIPRTLAMIESSLIDFTFIRDLPFPKDITTRVIGKQNFPELLRHITAELEDNKQVVIVYPLVEEGSRQDYLSLKEGEQFWRQRFEGVYVTHGKDREKEKVLEAFRDGGRILLATTVIEVGISLPRLSTIVIVGAERLGLATLHQLRGRVSRNGVKGYCFLYTHNTQSERLKNFAGTLSGFEIAELDLRYRKGGDLLSGERQSGEAFKYFDLAQDGRILAKAKAILSESKR